MVLLVVWCVFPVAVAMSFFARLLPHSYQARSLGVAMRFTVVIVVIVVVIVVVVIVIVMVVTIIIVVLVVIVMSLSSL